MCPNNAQTRNPLSETTSILSDSERNTTPEEITQKPKAFNELVNNSYKEKENKMPQQYNPSGQDWDAVNVGKGSLAGKKAVPKTARGVDMAKAAGIVATEKRYVCVCVGPWPVRNFADSFCGLSWVHPCWKVFQKAQNAPFSSCSCFRD
jgi:hypothetical protein